MSVTSKFAFTNGTDFGSACTLKVKKLDFSKDYALATDEPDSCVVVNKTTPIDQNERITFACRKIKTVASGVDNVHPAPVETGVQYQVKVEELLSTVSDTDPNFRVDEPIVAYLTIRHPMSNRVSNSTLQIVLERLLGACYHDDGSLRFEDIMKSALRP